MKSYFRCHAGRSPRAQVTKRRRCHHVKRQIVFHNLQKFSPESFSEKAFYLQQIAKSRRFFPITTLNYLQRKSREILILTAGIIEKCYKIEQNRLNKLETNRTWRSERSKKFSKAGKHKDVKNAENLGTVRKVKHFCHFASVFGFLCKYFRPTLALSSLPLNIRCGI